MSNDRIRVHEPSLAETLAVVLDNDLFKAVNFVVSDTLQEGLPICFVSGGFCRLTGGRLEKFVSFVLAC